MFDIFLFMSFMGLRAVVTHWRHLFWRTRQIMKTVRDLQVRWGTSLYYLWIIVLFVMYVNFNNDQEIGRVVHQSQCLRFNPKRLHLACQRVLVQDSHLEPCGLRTKDAISIQIKVYLQFFSQLQPLWYYIWCALTVRSWSPTGQAYEIIRAS